MEKSELINNIIESHRLIIRFMLQDEPDAWMDLNLTIAQVKSLFYIANHSEVNFRLLAKALKVTPSNVTGIIDRLSEQDLVLRVENPQDRRMLMLKLTPRGSKLIANLREHRVNRMSGILSNMEKGDLQTILNGFTTLSNVVKQVTYEQP
ncbi:MAG TPA: MarR family transcriptional regulator [Dehalococcoidales bacterium]|nr:MarR family transcriptional regulator [Dehalococcoidales bacterium]